MPLQHFRIISRLSTLPRWPLYDLARWCGLIFALHIAGRSASSRSPACGSSPAVVLRTANGIIRWEYAFVHRASFSYQAESFALGLRDKSDNFTHIRLQL